MQGTFARAEQRPIPSLDDKGLTWRYGPRAPAAASTNQAHDAPPADNEAPTRPASTGGYRSSQIDRQNSTVARQVLPITSPDARWPAPTEMPNLSPDGSSPC